MGRPLKKDILGVDVIGESDGTTPNNTCVRIEFWNGSSLEENGSIIKLYQQSAVTSSQGLADVLTNVGLLATGSSIATVDQLQIALTSQMFG